MSNITNKDLKTFHQEYDLAKLAYSKHPNSKVAKDTYVQATVRLAEGMMDSDSLLPKQKYPGALKLFREALTADPANQQAQQSKDLIESIYKQMRRPIPQ